MSVLRPDLMMKCVVPVIMAGIIAVSYAVVFRLFEMDSMGGYFRSTVWSLQCLSLETVCIESCLLNHMPFMNSRILQ
jgi:hypothetical protein